MCSDSPSSSGYLYGGLLTWTGISYRQRSSKACRLQFSHPSPSSMDAYLCLHCLRELCTGGYVDVMDAQMAEWSFGFGFGILSTCSDKALSFARQIGSRTSLFSSRFNLEIL
jgi:hypothetical protein